MSTPASFQSEALIATQSGAKYVGQLAKHWGHKFEVTTDGDVTMIPFSDTAKCLLTPGADGVSVRIVTQDRARVERLQDVVFEHISRFAFREELVPPLWVLKSL